MIGEGVVGVAPGDTAVVGADGMIGVPPGEPGAAGLGVGETGATGFVGADEAAVNAAGRSAAEGSGFPMMGGGAGASKRDADRHRQAWMAEDADVWEGSAETAPSQIGA